MAISERIPETLLSDSRPTGLAPPRQLSLSEGGAVMSPAARLGAAAVVLVTLAIVALSSVFGADDLFSGSMAFFLLVEIGIAPVLLLKPMSAMWFSLLSLATGLATGVAVGVTMSSLDLWRPGAAVTIVVVATLIALVPSILRDLRAMGGGWTAPRLLGPSHLLAACTTLGLVAVIAAALGGRTDPEKNGLFSSMGPGWYLGLAILVACVVVAKVAGISPALPIIALSGVVVLSQAIAYGAPAVMSAARHVGIIDYIRQFGGADPSLDIYQAWSGMFASIAWIADAARIEDVLVIATWWPVLLSPALAIAVAALASRWVRGTFRIWFAAALFALPGSLNITYFSPQSLGLFLALTIFALCVDPARIKASKKAGAVDGQSSSVAAIPVGRLERLKQATGPMGVGRLLFVLYLSCAMAVSHQISPYLTAGALIVLAVFGFVRPWYTILLVLLPAVAWAVQNAGLLKQFIFLGAVGRFWENAKPPEHTFTQLPTPAVTQLAFYVPALALVIVGLVALYTVLKSRTKYAFALLLAAASPASLFAATDYGQEGIFRVTLFAGPWLAVIAAGVPWKWRPTWTPVLGGGLAVLLAVNVFGQTALDWNRVMSQDLAKATLMYETIAADGSVVLMTGTGNATPLARTYRTFDVGYISREALDGYPDPDEPYDAVADVARMTRALKSNWPSTEYYALVSTPIGAYDERYGFQSYADYLELSAAMADSPQWEPIFESDSATLYKETVQTPLVTAAG
jgi:hypothetical protein